MSEYERLKQQKDDILARQKSALEQERDSLKAALDEARRRIARQALTVLARQQSWQEMCDQLRSTQAALDEARNLPRQMEFELEVRRKEEARLFEEAARLRATLADTEQELRSHDEALKATREELAEITQALDVSVRVSENWEKEYDRLKAELADLRQKFARQALTIEERQKSWQEMRDELADVKKLCGSWSEQRLAYVEQLESELAALKAQGERANATMERLQRFSHWRSCSWITTNGMESCDCTREIILQYIRGE